MVRAHSFDARSVLVKQERTRSSGTAGWGGQADHGRRERKWMRVPEWQVGQFRQDVIKGGRVVTRG